MDKLPDKAKLMAYVPTETEEIERLANLLHDNGFDMALLTTKEFFEKVKFKEMSPRA